jgi:hypothetical protein
MRNNKKIKLKQEQKEVLEKKEVEEEKKEDWRYTKFAIFINHQNCLSFKMTEEHINSKL